MERPVKDGILYVQHCKFGKRSWRKMRAQLFAASPSGVARMEKFDVRDDGTALEKTSLKRCARRVIRLSDCVSVGPAGTESCPKATAAFYLTTTEKSYVLAAEERDEWIAQLCQLAFQAGTPHAARVSQGGLGCVGRQGGCCSPGRGVALTSLCFRVRRRWRRAVPGASPAPLSPWRITPSTPPGRTVRAGVADRAGAGRRSDSGEGTFTFSTPRAPELCRAVTAAIACQQQGKDTPDPRLFCAPDPQLSAQGLEPQPWLPGAEDPQPSPPLAGAQPASHPPASLLRFPEPEPTAPIVYASIARGQQPLFGPGQPGPSEPWAAGKLPPEHLYENIFTAEPGPAGAEEEEEEEEGQWELGCRQAPEGHSSEAGPLYDNRAALAQLPRGSPQPPEQRWGRGAQEAPPGRSGHKPQSNLRAKLVRLLSRETPGPRDWA
ncbi:DOK3 protein, partial [Mesembrinibis cayennensis]|nr:DOK3 protein [Mesembrinibis cayennensis]